MIVLKPSPVRKGKIKTQSSQAPAADGAYVNIHIPLWATDSAVFTLKEMLDTSKSIFFCYG